MVICEEYDLSYLVYEQTRRMNDLWSVLEMKESVITESTDLRVLNEAMADTIRSYMNKVVQGIQQVWNKFKERVRYIGKEILLKKYSEEEIKKALQAENVAAVNVTNFYDYDLDKLKGITLKTFDYRAMVSSLGSKEAFLKANYPDFYKDEKANMKSNIKTYITKSKQDSHDVTKQELQAMVDFVLKGETELVQSIQKNIDTINKTSQNIDSLANEISQQEPKQESGMSFARTMEYYFQEADEEKMTVTPDEKKDENGEEKKPDQSKQIKDAVTVFMKASTEIFSAQLAVSSEILNIYVRIISKYMSNWKAGNKKENEETKPEEDTGTDNTKIVQIK